MLVRPWPGRRRSIVRTRQSTAAKASTLRESSDDEVVHHRIDYLQTIPTCRSRHRAGGEHDAQTHVAVARRRRNPRRGLPPRRTRYRPHHTDPANRRRLDPPSGQSDRARANWVQKDVPLIRSLSPRTEALGAPPMRPRVASRARTRPPKRTPRPPHTPRQGQWMRLTDRAPSYVACVQGADKCAALVRPLHTLGVPATTPSPLQRLELVQYTQAFAVVPPDCTAARGGYSIRELAAAPANALQP